MRPRGGFSSNHIHRGAIGLRAALLTAALLTASAPVASAGVANAGLPGAPSSDPLAGMPWGIYTGSLDGVWPAYRRLHGRRKALMGKIALRPLTFWFGAWDSNRTVKSYVRDFIRQQTDGNPGALAQVAVFRLNPWEGGACTTAPSRAARAGYRRWIDRFAAGIGKSRVALVLQPDLPFVLCARRIGAAGIDLGLVRYAARRFSSLPYTTVYIDVGARDWTRVGQAVWMLRRAGVRYARGFSLNDTHFDSTGSELIFGSQIVGALARRGIRGRHFVINTAANGSPFKYVRYYRHHRGGDPPTCGDTRSRVCVTLGIPPTTDTADPRWGLSARGRQIAARYADAYLWESRPWLRNGAYPFELHRALSMASSTRF